MKIAVDRCVVVSGYTHPELEKIVNAFSIFNPQYRRAKNMGKRLYGIEPFHNYFLVEDRKGFIFLPACAHIKLKEMFPDAELVFNQHFEKNDEIKLTVKITPRNFQKEAIKVVRDHDCGIFKVPTGGGKTFLGSMITAGFKCNTLFICDTIAIYEQWVKLLSELFGMEVGQIQGKTFKIQPITVAMAPSLASKREQCKDLVDYFSMVIVDECQGIGPNNSKKKGHTVFETKQYYNRLGRSVQWFRAKKKFGLTDAAVRSDEQGDCIRYALGPVIYETPYDELEAAQAVVKPDLIVRPTNFDTKLENPSEDYVGLCWELIKDDDRTQMVVSDLLEEEGNSCLILANNKAYIRMLAGAMLERRPTLAPITAIITGNTPRNYRTAYIEMARRGQIKYLFATSLADKGMDIPILSCLFMPFPGKFEGTNKQRVGRVVRFAEGKDGAKVYDYVDPNVVLLRKQFIKRFKKSYLERCKINFDDPFLQKLKLRPAKD